MINGDLNRAYKISSDFKYEINEIKEKYKFAGFSEKFTDCVINQFIKINPIPMKMLTKRKSFWNF